MKNAEKNRDPERARKRAKADLRCAARKLEPHEALSVIAGLIAEETPKGEARDRIQSIYTIGLWIGVDLASKADTLLGNLTRDEVEAFQTCPTTGEVFHARLAKTLLLAVGDHIEREWSAESLKKAVRQARKIEASRP